MEKYFASIFRRLQIRFPEETIFISCLDQKLSALKEKMDSLKLLIFMERKQHKVEIMKKRLVQARRPMANLANDV